MRRAFTLVELLIVIGILGILYAVSVFFLDPATLKKKARDAQRIVDLFSLQTAIEAYVADGGTPPDTDGAFRQSDQAVVANGNLTKADGTGWLSANLTARLERLPIDPLNSGGYVYRYRRVGQKFEFDARLEFYLSLMGNQSGGDGGNSDNRLEKGTDLNLLAN